MAMLLWSDASYPAMLQISFATRFWPYSTPLSAHSTECTRKPDLTETCNSCRMHRIFTRRPSTKAARS